MNLILLEPDEIDARGGVLLSGRRADHVRAVLRAVPGQRVRVGVVDGAVGLAIVDSINPENVTLQCRFEATVPERPSVDLLLALPRPKVLRRLWAQLAAIGVGRIILTNAERVERNYFDTHVLSPDCYRPLLLEGLQQAQDTRLPRVSIHRQFRILVEDQLGGLCDRALRLVGDPGDMAIPVTRAIDSADGRDRVLIAIGPEGGWNDFERQLLQAHGFVAVGLSARTQRSDTACLSLLAVTHEALRLRPRPAGPLSVDL